MAVCNKTFNIYSRPPYRDQFVFIEPYNEVPLEEAKSFDCRGRAYRPPRETKGIDYRVTTTSGEVRCGPEGCC